MRVGDGAVMEMRRERLGRRSDPRETDCEDGRWSNYATVSTATNSGESPMNQRTTSAIAGVPQSGGGGTRSGSSSTLLCKTRTGSDCIAASHIATRR